MYTSIVLAALMGPGAAPQVQAQEIPSWQENYSLARKAGRQANKPLAVFNGSCEKGWVKLSQENKLAPAVEKLLASHYVCVYLDADSAKGKRMAEAFSITQGLVVSTRDGEEQAFRHSGPMSSKDLESTLVRFSNGYISLETESLESHKAPKAKHHHAAPTVYPGYAPSYFGGYGGGCPSCRR